MWLAAGALSAAQLAALTLVATFAIAVLDRLVKRWKASADRTQQPDGSLHPPLPPLPPAACRQLPASGRAWSPAAQVPDTRRQQFELQQEITHLQRQAAALNHPDTFAQARHCMAAGCVLGRHPLLVLGL